MKKIRELLFNRWVLGGLVVLLLCLVILLVGDAIAFFDWRPLETLLARCVLVSILILCWLGWEVIRAWRIRRANQSMLQGIAGADGEAESSARSAQEIATLQARFKEAVTVLRKARFKGRAGERQYLYQLPWYVIVGAPGSGKTTALVNSGLKFPLEEAGASQSIKGVGGTRNCDWWFTDEAVLLDTAGRYVTQDSEQKVDASAWLGFLDLLKRFRPRQPLNGAIVTVSISDLLYQTDAQRERYARDVRSRVQELHERLGLRFPVYVMVTKTDLLAGFTEFFGDMTREERAQVWGMTFDLNAAGTAVNYAGQFSAEFEGLERRLHARVLKRLHDERDLQRRCRIYSFPQQFSALRPLLGEFMEKAFGGSRFGEQPLVRGVYFTSGTQEGSPIDRVLGTLSRTFNLERKILPPSASSGKSFFINRLLHEVIFTEAGLVGGNEKKERQRRWITVGALAGSAALTVGLLAAWTLSYFNNGRLIEEATQKVAAAKGSVEGVPPAQAGDIAKVLPVLNALRDLPSGYASRDASIPVAYRFGLYQGDGIGERSIGAYQRALGDVLLTRVSLRLEEILARPQNQEQLYVALRGYLMLHQDKYLDPADLSRLMLFVWSPALPRDSLELMVDLEGHLKAALEARPVQTLAPRNDALVNEARRGLASMPVADRVYARLKNELAADASVPPFRVSEAAGPNAAQVLTRASGQPLTAGIEGLFTRDGYLKLFRAKAEKLAAELSKEESWVLGDSGARAQKVDPAKVFADVRERYAQDYEKQWSGLLADVRVARSSGLAQTIEQAKILSAPDSPLKRLVAAAAKELSLATTEDAAKQKAGKEAEEAVKSNRYGSLFSQGAKLAAPRPEDAVDLRFAPLRNLVAQQGPAGPAPIDGVMQSMSEFYTQLRAAEESFSRGQVSTALSATASKMRADADRYPEPVRTVLRDLAQTSTGQAAGAAQENIKRAVSGSASFCAKAIDGKYPFAKSSGEVLLDDFNKVFSPGGQLDAFFAGNLAQFVDTPTGREWRPRPGMEASAPSPATIRQYQRAAVIRDSFFRPGAAQAQVSVDVKLVAVSGANEVTFEHDGKATKLAPGSVVRVQWPALTPGAGTKLTVAGAPAIASEGPWALFRVLEKGTAQPGTQAGLVRLAFAPDAKRSATLDLQPTSVNNPFQSRELYQFQCPGQK
ncbi:MAG: type VI secretion system membrane subunit TssM [Burkholderiales bacterium]